MMNFLRRLFGLQVRNEIDDAAILRQTRRAFAGELSITREAGSIGSNEVLTIEPEVGHKIVVGSSRRGKS